MEICCKSLHNQIRRDQELTNKSRRCFFKEIRIVYSTWYQKHINRYTLTRLISSEKCMFRQQGTELPLPRNVISPISYKQKTPLQENLAPQRWVLSIFQVKSSSSTDLNIQLFRQKVKRKAIHQSELDLASKCSTSSSSLNSHLARQNEHTKRLHSAQIISMVK